MANMTRLEFQAELKVRGWSRFLDAELNRYINWGRDAVARAFKWPDTVASTTISDWGAAVNEHFILLSTIDPDGIREVKHVYLAGPLEGDRVQLKMMTDEEFHGDWVFKDFSVATNNSGQPTHYYVTRDRIFLAPRPNKDYNFLVEFIPRAFEMSGDSSTSGLPEQLDQAVLLESEALCFQRAHEFERMAVAQAEARRIVVEEMGDAGGLAAENHPRVIPYR